MPPANSRAASPPVRAPSLVREDVEQRRRRLWPRDERATDSAAQDPASHLASLDDHLTQPATHHTLHVPVPDTSATTATHDGLETPLWRRLREHRVQAEQSLAMLDEMDDILDQRAQRDTSTTTATERQQATYQRFRNRRLRREADQDQGARLRRVMSRLSRLHDSPASSYSDRVPQQNHLYDWSPENEAEGDDELDLLLADLRSSRSSPLDPLPALSQSQLEREARMPSPSRLLTANPDNSLRSTAILQAARRHPRFASISLPQSDRDPVTTSPHRSREPSSTHNTRQQIMQRITDQRARERERERENRERLSRAESFRRGYLEGSSRSASSPILGRTIQYLADLRGIGKVDAPSGLPADVTMMDHVHAKSTFSDYVLDTASLPPPAPSSWLLPGAVLSGFQHATAVVSALRNLPGGASTTYRFRNGDSMSSTMFDTTRPWPNPESSLSPFRGPLRNQSPETVVSFAPDRWPVKVTIHAVDYESMSLCATMEAYNVPSHPQLDLTQSILNSTNAVPSSSSLFTRTSSITTYLEGEIIDFDKHTLLTESFKSDPDNDATYWAKLPCFSDYSDQELVKNLTSKRWIKEVLMAEWILMRWKERCFVKPLSHSENRRGDTVVSAFDDSSCGLTISGFYYTCLRRSDGKLDGLYYDPQSTPYQCLQLESVRGVFPAWDFR